MQSAEYMSTAFIEKLYSTGTIFTQIPWLPPQLSTQAAFVQFPQATGKQLSGCTEVYNAERRRQKSPSVPLSWPQGPVWHHAEIPYCSTNTEFKQ